MTSRFAASCSVLLLAAVAVTLTPAPGAAQLVERVVDGDTIIVRGVGRVRLIGVDTPETVDPRRPVECFGKEASAFTKRMLEGQRARLEYDQDRTDRYGRALERYDDNGNGRIACAEARRHGIAPVPRNHPAYPYMRDADGDGVVCE